MAKNAPVPDALTDAQAFVDSHRDEGTTELFGITELCREFGITLRALRFFTSFAHKEYYSQKAIILSPFPYTESNVLDSLIT